MAGTGADKTEVFSEAALRSQLAELKVRYGAKFNAITAALGHACEAQRLLEEDDDTEQAAKHLDRVIAILADA